MLTITGHNVTPCVSPCVPTLALSQSCKPELACGGARQACFLTRGDLYVSWERGRDTFDRLLIDGDPSINSANWLWLSASAFFHQARRAHSRTPRRNPVAG